MGRLSTIDYEKILHSKRFDMNFGGAEANVSVTMANLGVEKSAFISALPDNDLGNSVIRYLKCNNVVTDHIVKTEGRLGLYFVETGFSQRNSTVIYDRKDSAIAKADPEIFNFEVQDLACRPCSKIGFQKCPKGHFKCMELQDALLISQQINKGI